MGDGYEQRHKALMALAGTLTAEEAELFMERAVALFPRMNGATPADVLDHTTDYDEFLDRTEPFYEQCEGRLPQAYGTIIAMHALIIMDRELTFDAMTGLLERAGLAEPPYDPTRDLATLAHGIRKMTGPFSPAVAAAMSNLRKAGVGVNSTRDDTERRVRELLEGR